jgi:hypothetical protein
MSVNTRRECPDCEGHQTERVCIEFEQRAVIEVRICDECELEYETHFVFDHQEVVYYE